MQLHITHETCYDYTPAVSIAQHMAYLKPRNTSNQQVLSHTLSITPEPSQQTATLDVYGNTRAFFSLQAAHTQLHVVARSLVATQAPPLWDNTVPWEQVRERFRYCAKNPFDAAADFVFASPYVPRHADFADYARPSFSAEPTLLLAARDLMQRIYRDFTYESHSTEINTPAREALARVETQVRQLVASAETEINRTLVSADLVLEGVPALLRPAFDGRYFGPINRSQIKTVIRPVITW